LTVGKVGLAVSKNINRDEGDEGDFKENFRFVSPESVLSL
jgi:hypothetical protein